MRDTVVILLVPQIRVSGHMGTQSSNHSCALDVCLNQFTLSENWSQSFANNLLKIRWAASAQKSIEVIALVCRLELFFQVQEFCFEEVYCVIKHQSQWSGVI